ncbi:MAG: FixH family protein [Armatimonadota bacterium]
MFIPTIALPALTTVTPINTIRAATSLSIPQPPAGFKLIERKSGNISITLRVPDGGVFAGEAIDIEFRVTDTSKVDPVFGATGIPRVVSKAVITMPEMAGMPEQRPKIHTEGIPGDYGIECFFPHGGEYKIALSLQIPGIQEVVRTDFLVDVRDEAAPGTRKAVPKPYIVDVKTKSAAKAGDAAVLQFTIRETKSKAIVKDFDIAHTKIFHLLIVSKDLSWFAHEHPKQQPDGTFTHNQIFPAGGQYYTFADVAPRGAGSQILMGSVKVAGTTPAAIPLVPSGTTNIADGIKVNLKGTSNIPIGKSLPVTFQLTVTSTGDAITDLEPYLGAYGHLMIIHADGQTVVHSHPAEDEAGIIQSKRGIVTFNSRFPKAGIYKAWGQFQRGGKVVTIPFVISVGGAK